MKKLFNNIRSKLCEVADKGRSIQTDRKGEVAVNTIGAIIIAVVIIGLLVLAGFLTPPDIVSQIALALPCWLFYELSILVFSHYKRKERPEENNEVHP